MLEYLIPITAVAGIEYIKKRISEQKRKWFGIALFTVGNMNHCVVTANNDSEIPENSLHVLEMPLISSIIKQLMQKRYNKL